MPGWSEIIPLLINILIVSIPEETFLVVFSLMLMKRYDLIEFKKNSILRISYVVLPVAILSNILRVFGGFDGTSMPFLATAVIFLLIVLVFGIRSPKGILKAFISVCASSVVLVAFSLAFFPLITSVTNFDAQMLNKPGPLVILLSLPERILEIITISMMLLKKKSFMKMGFFKAIMRSKALANISGIIAFLNLLFMYLMFRLIYLDKVFINLNMATQFLIIIMAIFFPILNMTIMLSVITYTANKLTYTKVHIQEESRVLRVLVNMLLRQRKFEDIDAHLGSFVEEVKKIK